MEVKYSGVFGFGHKGDAVKPPNISVGGELMGTEPLYADIEEAVLRGMGKG